MSYKHSIQTLRHIERCCAGVNDFQQERSDDAKAAADLLEAAPQTIKEIVDAQADLQTALGFHRLGGVNPEWIEDRMARSLARSHSLLASLGCPMYQPATHPDIRLEAN